jgi:hypothetical protein
MGLMAWRNTFLLREGLSVGSTYCGKGETAEVSER